MRLLVLLAVFVSCTFPAYADFSHAREVPELLAQLRRQNDFSSAEIGTVRKALRDAKFLPQLIQREKHPKEKTLTWPAYARIHINPANISDGLAFMQQQRRWLERAKKRFGVPPTILTALLGVETKYGRDTGHVRVLDALATMAFGYPTREPFFTSELREFFVLCRDNDINPSGPLGSYAGAMGYAQFMPSSVLRLGLDFNHNGQISMWSAPDAIGSVANYLVHFDPKRAWRRGMPLMIAAHFNGALSTNLSINTKHPTTTVAELEREGFIPSEALSGNLRAGIVRLDDGHGWQNWIVLHNFYSLLSYNSHIFYAMAVAQLAEALKTAESAEETRKE